jgi:hypothetical protein
MREVFADDNADSSRGAAGRKPITPAHDESREISNSAARVVILATAFGDGCAKLRKLKGTDKCIKRPAEPHGEEQPRVRKPRGDITRRADDSCRYSIAHSDRDAETYAKNLKEFAFVLTGLRGKSSGQRVGSRGQSWVSRTKRDRRHHTLASTKSKPEMCKANQPQLSE